MPITAATTPDMLRLRQEVRRMSEDATASMAAVGDALRSNLGPNPKGMTPAANPQTEAANNNDLDAGDELDDNTDIIDENGALAATVEDGGDILDCGVCYLPLRPPIFQCESGHALCYPCHRKLMAIGNRKCHVCRVDIDSDDEDNRCFALERLVTSIRVPCPNAAHGCAARMTYYDRISHREACPHARYSCSGHGCAFVGSVGALLDHVASVHTNNDNLRQFWTEEISWLMYRLKLHMAAADIGIMRVWPRTIEIVMRQARVSMDKAIKALKESDGNFTTAVRKLTI